MSLKRASVAVALAVTLAGCDGNNQPAAHQPPAAAQPAAGPAETAVRVSGPPSIVLISIDTLRSDRLPAYGYQSIETPAIDALRRDAVLFESAWAQAPMTMPSHASILTGLLPADHGVRDNIGYHFDAESVAYLPRLLKDNGYATGAAVSAYVLRGEGGFAGGFELYEDSIERRPRAGAGGLQRPGGQTLQAILPWLRQRGSKPFLLFFHLFEPHTPYQPSYDADVVAADRVVGHLLAELRRLDLYERSVVVLLSDHGEGLGDHGEEEHGVLLYRESLQVPLLLKLPGSRHAGRSVAAPVALIDVLPTLLGLAGLPAPAGLPGTSLTDLLASPAPAPARAIYAETFFPRLHFGWSDLASLLDGRFHYIEGPAPELYDLVADPAETHNLIAEQRSVAARLRDELAAYDRRLVAAAETDAQEREALAALGYVGSAVADPDAPLPDPKSRLSTVEDLKNGLRFYSAGELESAVAAYRRAVAANPRSLDAWEYLGRSLHQLGRGDEALEALGQALELAGGRASHLAVASALMLLNSRRPDAALELLRREIVRSPSALELRLLEARCLVLTGRPDEALASAEHAVRRAPDNADALYMRGAVAIALRTFAEAERDLRRAIELAPDHTAAMSDLAALLQQQGDLPAARRLLERVLELNPGDALAARNLRGLEVAAGAGGRK